jgi:hypothetical protein
MFTLLMVAVLAQTPDSPDPIFEAQKRAGQDQLREKPKAVSPGNKIVERQYDLYVPTHDAVTRCVNYVSDVTFREKLRDLADLLNGKAKSPLGELAPTSCLRAATSIHEFLIHQNYETAVIMLMSVHVDSLRDTKITVAVERILRSTDSSVVNPYGWWYGRKLSTELYATVRLNSIAALESNATLKELHRLYPKANDVDSLLRMIDDKYSGKDKPEEAVSSKEAA